MKKLSLVLFGLSFLAPPALAQDEADEEKEEKICVNSRTINRFDALSDNYVYVEATGKNYYLFTMRNRCRDLSRANGIAIKDTTSRVCSDAFAEIVYMDMGRRKTSCRIDKIVKVSSKDEAREIVEAAEDN